MNKEQYIKAVMRELKVSPKEKKRIKKDLASHISAALEEGQEEQEILSTMGTPREQAEEFNLSLGQNAGKYSKKQKIIRIFLLSISSICGINLLLSLITMLKVFDIFQSENAALSIIGGSDGPTSIFIAGKISSPLFPCSSGVIFLSLFVFLLCTVMLFRIKKH